MNGQMSLRARLRRAKQSSSINWIASSCSALLAMTTVVFSAPSDIQSTYQSIQDLKADFTQSTYIAILDTTVKERGVFMMKKPGMLRIEYTGEHPKTYLSNGKKVWVIDKELRQVETYKVSNESVPKEALEFLKGFGNMEMLFTIAGLTPKKPVKDHTYLKLIPKTAGARYKYLECDFGPDNILKAMTINNKSGNISTYVFSNVKTNMGLDDGLFGLK